MSIKEQLFVCTYKARRPLKDDGIKQMIVETGINDNFILQAKHWGAIDIAIENMIKTNWKNHFSVINI